MTDILNVNFQLDRGTSTSVLTLRYTIRFNATELPCSRLLSAKLEGGIDRI